MGKRDRPAVLGLWRLIAGALLLGPWPTAAAAQETVDLELVLAVDASGSVDDGEFRLQLEGIAAAFRDARVVEAIQQGPTGSIAVALALWAESNHPKDATAWYRIDDAASAAAFADRVERQTRTVAGGTGLGAAIFYGARLITNNDYNALRKVIDVSGDGRETTFRDWAVPPDQARHKVRSLGITVNGLVILNDDPALEAYYRQEIIHGPDAFIIAVADYRAFAAAMRRKLIREIRARPQMSRRPGPP